MTPQQINIAVDKKLGRWDHQTEKTITKAGGKYTQCTPDYARDISAAWHCMRKMLRQKVLVDLRALSDGDGTLWGIEVNHDHGGRLYPPSGFVAKDYIFKTAAEAICMAFLGLDF